MGGRIGKMEQIICTHCNGKGFTEEDGYTRTCRVCDGDPVITFETVKEYAFQIDDLRFKYRVLEEKLSAEKDIAAWRAGEIKLLKEVERLRREAKIEALEWVSQDSTVSYEQIEDEIARLNQDIVRLRNEGTGRMKPEEVISFEPGDGSFSTCVKTAKGWREK